MTVKKSIKASLSGIGTSSISFLGICGGGACAATCGITFFTPIASLFGISSAGLSAWTSQLLPLLTAISAIAFTIAFYSLYKKKNSDCCEDSTKVIHSKSSNHWGKSIFWIGLFLTIGIYANAMMNNNENNTKKGGVTDCYTQSDCSEKKSNNNDKTPACSTKKQTCESK